MARVLAAGILAMVLTILGGPRFIRWLRDRDIGQTIRDEGPEHHTSKQGTPTMGGLLILVAAALPFVFLGKKTVPSMMVFFLIVGSGAIGLMDDLAKVRRKRSLGLSARSKMALQVLLVVVFGWFAVRFRGGRDHRHDPAPQGGHRPRAAVLRPDVPGGLGLLERGQPHRRPGRVWPPAPWPCVCLVYTGITFLRHETDLAILAVSLTGALRRLPVVQLVPGRGVHGRHRFARPGRGAGGLAIVTDTELLLILIGGSSWSRR